MHWSSFLSFLVILRVNSINGYVSQCVKAGVKCADCETLVHCVTTPTAFNTFTLNKCNNSLGEYCSVKEGGCSADPASCKIFGLKEMACQNSSTFPDPYDCAAYHQCIEQADKSYASFRHDCPSDRAYDPMSATCRFKPNHRVCKDSPVPFCMYPLQTGALKENPSIYYVCVKKGYDLTPYLYRCRNGEEYKATAHACIETQDSSNFKFKCVGKGTFVDSSDSRKYYNCRDDGAYTHETCETGEYFDINRSSCQTVPQS